MRMKEESWEDVSVDESPLCENEMIVQCYRSELKVHVNTGLVISPRCRNISPAFVVITIGCTMVCKVLTLIIFI
jgi:hypothetical protein